mmetsp:Transcript_79758/g.231517  ORF Transcript_79758/g.231517 Transcript_79758/m.231517 type:complete len:303 (-) Transcript_79758:163-1071(-)
MQVGVRAHASGRRRPPAQYRETGVVGRRRGRPCETHPRAVRFGCGDPRDEELARPSRDVGDSRETLGGVPRRSPPGGKAAESDGRRAPAAIRPGVPVRRGAARAVGTDPRGLLREGVPSRRDAEEHSGLRHRERFAAVRPCGLRPGRRCREVARAGGGLGRLGWRRAVLARLRVVRLRARRSGAGSAPSNAPGVPDLLRRALLGLDRPEVPRGDDAEPRVHRGSLLRSVVDQSRTETARASNVMGPILVRRAEVLAAGVRRLLRIWRFRGTSSGMCYRWHPPHGAGGCARHKARVGGRRGRL